MAAHNNAQTGLMGTYDANNVYFTIDGKTAYGYGATPLFTFSYDTICYQFNKTLKEQVPQVLTTKLAVPLL